MFGITTRIPLDCNSMSRVLCLQTPPKQKLKCVGTAVGLWERPAI